ncbi:MAG: acyl-CoA dehydrogenase [Gammaproteobacteria bacterium]|nr:acyl-CoA dehydrogenase [Gammaproteobacteria bacterium]
MENLISSRDLAFQLYEVLACDELCQRAAYYDHNRETFDAVLDTARKIAEKYFVEHNHKGDQNEPVFVDGKVEMIPEVKVAFDAQAEAGFLAAGMPYELNGMQLPHLITLAASGYFTSANPSSSAYAFLTIAASNLLNTFASDAQKQLFMQPMLEGRFAGTMALTEPSAGSSLSDITTNATPIDDGKQNDGTYKIKGQKIFISGGEQNITENIVHLVLAKIKGAPAGVKGISLFIVPKFRLDADGNPDVKNDVNLAGLFHKMGYRGTTSTHLSFGENDDCVGYLIGEPHHGLKYMFHMMNEARLGVGFGAVMMGYRGYLESLNYAKERPQGRKPSEKDPSSPPVNIIEHADIRRMLLAQKSFVEAGTALCFYAAHLVDDTVSANEKEQKEANELLDLLTPIVKSCCSDYGLKANEHAIQVLGGAGYTHEYPVEQCYRDNRLNPIHEGTNGIQALDLLGRKVWQNNSAGLKILFARMMSDINSAQSLEESKTLADTIATLLSTIQQVTENLGKAMVTQGPDKTLANAHCYLTMMGKVVFAWMWLRQSVVAENALASGESLAESEQNFYKGKIQAAKYFEQWELPNIEQDIKLLNEMNDVCFEMKAEWF